MSKFIKYRIIEENGVQYDCYIAADIIRGVSPVYIKDEQKACELSPDDIKNKAYKAYIL